jgi:hypothetical protein
MEFLPLLQSRLTVVVDMAFVDEYVADFFPHRTRAGGSLIIFMQKFETPLGLASLLRLYAASPSLRIYVSPTFCSLPPRLIPKDRSEAWLLYAINSISRLKYIRYSSTSDEFYDKIEVFLTHDAFKAFASEGGKEISAQHWADLVGFPEWNKYRMIFTVREAPVE